jgi:AraC-like DNA-binding protein
MDLRNRHVVVQYTSTDGTFRYHHARDERPDPGDYMLHYEKGYELYMFISGLGSYTIEGSRYELEPYSILMINSNELHVVNISEDQPYERIVLNLSENILPPFLLNGVDFFRSFKFRKLGHDNQIHAEKVADLGLLPLFEKLQGLLERKSAENEIVAKCVIIEILSIINHMAETTLPEFHKSADHKVGAVLEFINANLNEQLNLDSLSERFFVTKYHLCRIFREATGFSINQYITYKRIHMADGLMLEGNTPTQACFMAGFNNYSNFYKSYRKLTGKSPKSSRVK